MGGSQAKKATAIQTDVADRSKGLSTELGIEAKGQRQMVGDYYKSIAGGDPVALARATAPKMDIARQQYAGAQKQLERALPKGGARDAAQQNLSIAKAGDVTRILTGGVDNAYAALDNLGKFNTQGAYTGMSVGSNAGESLARLSAAKANAVGQGIAGIAGFGGSMLGMKSAGGGGGGGGTGGITPTNSAIGVQRSSSALGPVIDDMSVSYPPR